MLTNQLFEQHVTVRNGYREHTDISRLLAAAVVSRQFCSLLLADPAQAINMGFAGEKFSLTAEEYDLVLSAHASTLSEFAQQISIHMPGPRPASRPAISEQYQMRI